MALIVRHQVCRPYELSLYIMFTYIIQCLNAGILLSSSLQWPFKFGYLNAYKLEVWLFGIWVSPSIDLTAYLLMFYLLNHYSRISVYSKKDIIFINHPLLMTYFWACCKCNPMSRDFGDSHYWQALWGALIAWVILRLPLILYTNALGENESDISDHFLKAILRGFQNLLLIT